MTAMTVLRAMLRIATTVLAVFGASLALVTTPAFAQNFVKVDEAGREQLPATPFVGVAYGFIWVAVLVYVFFVARRLGRLQNELRELRRKLDRGDASAGR